eukprot:751315-Prymnesium_polylepis.1
MTRYENVISICDLVHMAQTGARGQLVHMARTNFGMARNNFGMGAIVMGPIEVRRFGSGRRFIGGTARTTGSNSYEWRVKSMSRAGRRRRLGSDAIIRGCSTAHDY